MISRTTAILVLCALFFIAPELTRASAPLFEKGGLTLKKMNEAIDMAENRGKFRLRLNYEQGSLQARKFDGGTDSKVVADISGLKMKKGTYKVSELKADVSAWKFGDLSGDLSRAPKKYVPWESSRHFALAVGEGAMFNIFIPWALARWGRDWENSTEERWPFIGFQSIWSNLQEGWNYDGDNFLTNLFSHPYGGNLFFNSGRSNGYNFWESSAFALAGSYIWETFMETNQPAINDWVNTGMNGAAFGEVLYRLSTLVTDNTARGSHRVWTEIAGGIINPVRLFTRLVTGEASRVFDNPSWRKPEMLNISLNAGTRVLFEEDKVHNPDSKELQGIFELAINYGDPHKLEHATPFSHFYYNLAIASSYPSLTSMNVVGSLFAFELSDNEKTKHSLEATLNYNYINNPGFLYGNASIMENLNSYFKMKGDDALRTRLGIKLIPMGGTPNDYFYDSIDGRTYDFGQGLGWLGSLSYFDGSWEIFSINYGMDFIWTQSQPSFSKHLLHAGSVTLQLPLRDYMVVGVGAGYYKRKSYYFYPEGYCGYNVPGMPETNAPDVTYETPILRVFFKTRIL